MGPFCDSLRPWRIRIWRPIAVFVPWRIGIEEGAPIDLRGGGADHQLRATPQFGQFGVTVINGDVGGAAAAAHLDRRFGSNSGSLDFDLGSKDPNFFASGRLDLRFGSNIIP